jgi:Ca-activated chloride channel family protein
MQSVPDLYASLGASKTATPEQLRQAYRMAARRFHPDSNRDPQAGEEFKVVAQAYEVLNDPARRAEYDAHTVAHKPFFNTKLTSSRAKLLRLPDPQVVYALMEIAAQPGMTPAEPPLNLCLVIDQSTSMQGQRLEQVKQAARQIVENLAEQDFFSVVTFSDRAEVVLPAQHCLNKPSIVSRLSAIQAGGGTEILHGLLYGLMEIQQNLSPGMLNHLVLLTDGRTYGDEDDCLLLAKLAEADGIIITGLGIGDEWNDAFVDQLSASTGGHSEYISSPAIVTRVLTEQVRVLSDSLGRVTLQVICDPGIQLKSVFRVSPEAQPITSDSSPFSIGKLELEGSISLLLEFVVGTTADVQRSIARLRVNGDILASKGLGYLPAIDFQLAQADQPDSTPPPLSIVGALDKLTLYRLQERAWADAEEGNIVKATQRLQTLASRLMATGEKELATIALSEANRLNQTHQISAENRKRIKYGTRALIPPSAQDSK